MLLRLVRIVPDAFRAWGGGTERGTRHLRAHETLYRVQARSRGAPVVLAVPGKSLPKRFGDAPSVCVTESGEYGPRRCRAECLDEFLPEEPERDGIEQEHALASEGDASALGDEMQQFVNIEIGGAHQTLREVIQNESQAYHFDSHFGRRRIGSLYKLLKTNVGQSWRPPCLVLGVQRMDAEIQEEQMATERWEIDSSHSSLHFSVRHLVIAKVRGSFARWSGTIQVPDGDFSKATVAVTIDASSIDTGVADRDAHLKSPDFFDAAQHAELRFVGKRVQPRSGTEIDVVGDLTIKGITREVVLRVERHGQAKDPWGNVRAAFTAKTSIDRKDFGLTWNQVLETGGVMVGDRVEIEADIEAVKQVEAQVA